MQSRRESRVESRVPARGAPSGGCSQPSIPDPRRSTAFTLLEIMMVVAIIGLMMAMGVPAILRTMHEGPLRKAVNDVMNICSHARAQAILDNVPTTVVFHPRSREVTLVNPAITKPPDDFISPNPQAGKRGKSIPGVSALNSTQFGDGIVIDMLDVNFVEYKDADEARVQFFPNGTSDGMTLILDARGQYREISLDVMTGRASMKVIR